MYSCWEVDETISDMLISVLESQMVAWQHHGDDKDAKKLLQPRKSVAHKNHFIYVFALFLALELLLSNFLPSDRLAVSMFPLFAPSYANQLLTAA